MVRGVYLCVFLRNEKSLALIFIRSLEITNTEKKEKSVRFWWSNNCQLQPQNPQLKKRTGLALNSRKKHTPL
jgi:hypothetical protein